MIESMKNLPTKLVIASRESRLALWQSEHVRAQLQRAHPGCQVDILGMTTRGDQILDRSLSKVGGKGLFVKELEVALLENKAKEVYAYISHGVLSGGAVKRISGSRLKELVITDSIQPTKEILAAGNIRVLEIAPLIGEAIGRTATEESVSSLFD